MGLFLLGCVSFTILVLANAKLTDDNDDWVYVPNRNGMLERVNKTMALSQVQPFFSAESSVKFELYTLQSQRKPDLLIPNDIESIKKSHLDKSRPTRIYIHGWQEWGGLMKGVFNRAYLKKAKKDVNLIAVNWESVSRTPNYVAAAHYVEPIGIHVASLIDFLVSKDMVALNDIQVIGFSLGAHIAGVAGKYVKSGKLPKIVGLDPAGPMFSLDRPYERLDQNDAKYVEVINTSGSRLGFFHPIGTTSFYPNRGMSQLGCRLDPTGVCSHVRAYQYFAESLYSTISFYAYPCDSMENLEKGDCRGPGIRMGGEPGNYKAPASIYYLTTNSRPIFAQGGSRDAR